MANVRFDDLSSSAGLMKSTCNIACGRKGSPAVASQVSVLAPFASLPNLEKEDTCAQHCSELAGSQYDSYH